MRRCIFNVNIFINNYFTKKLIEKIDNVNKTVADDFISDL